MSTNIGLLESVVEFILLYRPDIAINFNWDSISSHSHISFAFVDSHKDQPWSHYYLSRNRSITWETFTTHLEYDWDWFYISNHADLDFNFVLAHPEFNWDFRVLSYHPNINAAMIQAHIELPWDWVYIARNKNLTYEFITTNIDKFDLEFITRNDIITDT